MLLTLDYHSPSATQDKYRADLLGFLLWSVLQVTTFARWLPIASQDVMQLRPGVNCMTAFIVHEAEAEAE